MSWRRSGSEKARDAGAALNRPFRGLRQFVGAAPARTLAPPPPQPEAAPVVGDEDLFLREMAGVRSLDEGPARLPGRPPVREGAVVPDAEAEGLAELADLVSGATHFDVADTTEFIEGCVVGLDPRLLRQLRGGDFSYQGHIDLHGMTVEEARAAVDRFLLHAYRRGQRCVLVIHGRGLNSKDHVPVLKARIVTWLARGAPARVVLAFSSARACDGGTGALYVLLRQRKQRKQEFRVTEGAKW